MKNKKNVRLMLVDDHPVVIEGLKALLKSYDWIEIVEVAMTGSEALSKLRDANPQIVLLDIALPDMTGVKVAEEIQKGLNRPAVIAYTMYNDPEYLRLLFGAGVKGSLPKDGSVDELVDAIDVVANGGTYFSPKTTGRLLEGLFGVTNKKISQSESVASAALTNREKEIIVWISKGEKNKSIAEKLKLNARTVETHRRNIMLKLGIRTAAGLTRFAIENELV